jgi:hypothetical protein
VQRPRIDLVDLADGADDELDKSEQRLVVGTHESVAVVEIEGQQGSEHILSGSRLHIRDVPLEEEAQVIDVGDEDEIGTCSRVAVG